MKEERTSVLEAAPRVSIEEREKSADIGTLGTILEAMRLVNSPYEYHQKRGRAMMESLAGDLGCALVHLEEGA